MRDFNERGKSGGGRGGRRFGGGNFGRGGFGGRDRMMHKAVCANCGNECEVPFRPSGERPVYCSNCFEKRGSSEGSYKGPDRRDFQRPRFENHGNGASQLNGQILDQLKSLNAKLDKIVRVLSPIIPEETKSEESKVEEVKKVEEVTMEEPKGKKPRTSRKKTVEETPEE